MTVYLLALLIGIVAGLRAMIPLAAISWAAWSGWLNVGDGWLSFLEYRFTPWILSILALGELVTDKLPSTPSRKQTAPFVARVVIGGLAGAIIGANGGSWIVGLVAGAIGAVIGTLGGAAARAWLARAIGKDFPAALIEDIVAIGGAYLIMASLA